MEVKSTPVVGTGIGGLTAAIRSPAYSTGSATMPALSHARWRAFSYLELRRSANHGDV